MHINAWKRLQSFAQRGKRQIFSISASLAIVLMVLVFGATPAPAYAQLPTSVVVSVPDIANKVLTFVKEGLITAGKVGVKNAIRSFLEKIAYDTAVWIGSGDKNQKPLLFTKDIGSYLADAGDSAAGAFLDTLGSENGYMKLDLCNLNPDVSINVNVTLARLSGIDLPNLNLPQEQLPYKARCKASEALTNFGNNVYDQALSFAEDPTSFVNLSATYDDGANGLSTLLIAWDDISGEQAAAEREAEIERLKSDAKDKAAKISGYIETPSTLVVNQLVTTINNATGAETIQQDNIVADALSVFVNTLAAKLLENVSSGLLSFFTDKDISESLSGSGSTTSHSSGIIGAQEKFASFRTPAFTSGGTVDILTHFANCPEQGQDVTNCVINEGFRSAIEEGMSVKEAIDAQRIPADTPFGVDSTNPNDGISLRNVIVLRQYSVVPVGWELAANYYQDFDKDASEDQVTLGQLVDAFDHCSTDNYSPYCGLIDPNWVLKAPDVLCKTESYGEVIANESFADLDGNPYSPDEQLITRLSSCVDSQSCLSEDESGNCEAYGYCTKQKRIYRFEGESCPAYEASCTSYTDEDGNDASYLQNTLNYNDCDSSNAGCQWYCTEVTDSGEFLCANQGETYTVCGDENGCSCTASDSQTCTIEYGAYSCTTEGNTTCTLGTQTDEEANIDSAISFDDDVQACDSADGGCAEYISLKGGNILFNGSFEEFNSFKDPTVDDIATLPSLDETSTYGADTFGFYGDTGDVNSGEPCQSSVDGTCYGWSQIDGVSARAVQQALNGSVMLELQENNSDGHISAVVDTVQPLANRSFVLSYFYKNTSDTDSCTGNYEINADSGESHAATASYTTASDFQQINSGIVTFGPDEDSSTIRVNIYATTGCSLALDGVSLVETNDALTSFTDYGADRITINTNEAQACSVDEVGCMLYTPQSGESTTAVPGIITNSLSDACGNGDNLDNPACSQCSAEQVGCDAYIENPTSLNAPISDISGFTQEQIDAMSDDAVSAILSRTGYYCEDSETACDPSGTIDVCGGAACLPTISIIPSTGESCSATYVGCEAYTNLENTTTGGEEIEYYTYIKQCVQETQAQVDADEIGYYYTFEGSDVSGYQLRTWYLKKSNASSAPCTNLDVYGGSAQTAQADCIDDQLTPQTCAASDMATNPDCTEYYDADGEVYHVLKSATIAVSDECSGIRNNEDGRTYYALTSESTSCPSSANLCREYEGSQGGDAQVILDEDFDSSVWSGGEASSEVITANTGLSMAIGTGTTNGQTSATTSVAEMLNADSSYVVSFWAKKSNAADTVHLYPFFFSATSGQVQNLDDSGVELGTEWQEYLVGPFVFPNGVNSDETFGFFYEGQQANIDTVELRLNVSHYLIHGTSDLCTGFEGCEEYKDSDDETQYLKSFSSLCDESVVGCQALFDTHNSDSPYQQDYNTDNEYSEDDVSVPVDNVVTYAVNDSVMCSSDDVAGCSLFGEPTLDADGNVTSFNSTYLINDPDTYDTALCQEQQRSCSAYTTADGSVEYFQNPGEKLCTYNDAAGEWEKPDGTPCPLQSDGEWSLAPSQPKGAICVGGDRDQKLCSSDTDCTGADGVIHRCSANVDDNSGWVGSCNDDFAGCTLYVDPNTESLVTNGNMNTDVGSNTNITDGSPDGIPDNWSAVSSGTSNEFFANADSQTTIACNSFGVSGDAEPSFDAGMSFKLATNTNSATHCMATSDTVTVDVNGMYTLTGDVYLTNADTPFAIGLFYYDLQGEEIAVENDVASDYAIAAYEGVDRAETDDTIPTNQWVRFEATIGRNLIHEFPADAYFVKVFIETGNDSSAVYFDNLEFAPQEEYTYISSSVDGAPESEENTCAGVVNIDSGCVAFRDATNDSLSYLSSVEEEQTAANKTQTSYSFTTCEYNAATRTTNCDSRPNTADANTILKVRNDRECAQWLACALVDPNSTSDSENGGTCLEIRTCKKRNESTGECLQWADQADASSLGYDDDVSVVSEPGDTSDLAKIADVSGFASVGGQWVGAYCDDSSLTCVGGANSGNVCDSDATCEDAITYGYYPEDWIPERGLGGAKDELVPMGDFEEVSCDGIGSYTDTNLIYDASTVNKLERQRDKSMSCTLDYHCRTLETDSVVQTVIASDDAQAEKATDTNIEDIEYEQGWCENVVQTVNDDGTTTEIWGGNHWTTLSDAQMVIIDYQDGLDYTHPDVDVLGSAVAASTLDLNNVMYVQPQTTGAQEGLAVDLSSIIPGQEYTLSFDAQFIDYVTEQDLMQIGITHDSDFENVDYFETGHAKADLVFVIDASGSMSTYISNIATNTSAIVQGLEDSGIDYQVSIVTTGGGRTPAILDFSDYDDSGDASTDYGATNGITTSTTSSASTFQTAMNFIAGHLESGSAYNYQALKNIADNTFTYSAGTSTIDFRSGAGQFIVLLTDTVPEQDTYIDSDTAEDEETASAWDPTDETNFIAEFQKTPYTLYSIVFGNDSPAIASDAEELNSACGDSGQSSCTKPASVYAYNDITPTFGGSMYDISGSYSTILTDISSDIQTSVSNFTFSTSYEHYVLGPITIENKFDPASSSTLFFREDNDANNPAFVIDNVSLKPAIEVNKQHNPNSDNAAWLIGQSCRAYPEDSSLSCDYIDDSGVIYTGWKGYCLQQDLNDSSRCVAWWPVAGSSKNSSGTAVRYSQKYPVYHCLVAKGNANLGACLDDGTICTDKSDCGDSQCLGNGTSTYTVNNETVTVTTEGYKIINSVDLHIDDDPHGDYDEDNLEAAKFRRFPASNVDKLVHVSEIDSISFDIGTPENYGGKNYAHESNSWLIGKTSFDTADLETSTETLPEPENTARLYQSGYEEFSGAFDGEEINDNNEDAATAFQSGVWCGSSICTQDSIKSGLNDMDVVFVKAVTGKDAGFLIKGFNSDMYTVYNDQSIEDGIDSSVPLNPFSFSGLKSCTTGACSGAWAGDGIEGVISGTEDAGSQTLDGVSLDAHYFFSRYSYSSDYEVPSTFDTIYDGDCDDGSDGSPCGANIVGVNFDFNDGYLDAVYLFYWDGIRRWDVGDMKGVTWTYYLKEPCLLLVEGATEQAEATPWQERVTGSTGYQIPDVGYTYSMSGVNALFGSLRGDNNGSQPSQIDGIKNNGLSYFTASAEDNLPFVYLNQSEGSALPYACIGSCNATVCQNDYATAYSPTTALSACTNDSLWIGVAGICSSKDPNGQAVVCDSNDDCTAVGAGSTCEMGASYTATAAPATAAASLSTQGTFSAARCSTDGCDTSEETTIDMDTDTDGDGIPDINDTDDDDDGMIDSIDTDDDGDGILDVEEQESGSSSSGSNFGGLLSGAGVGADYTTYLDQLNAAASIAWKRYRLLFADMQGRTVWFANQDSTYTKRNEGLLSFVQDDKIDDTFPTAFTENGSFDFLDPDTMDVCENNTRTDDSEYCAVRPSISNMTVNTHTNEPIVIDSGDTVILGFDSSSDPDQEPVQQIQIDWKATDDSVFNTNDAQTDYWEAASTPGHSYTYVYTCDPTNPAENYHPNADDDTGRYACEFHIKVQIQDNWDFCSGDIHSGEADGDNVRTDYGDCTSYDEYTQTIYVKP
ncbi:MAG: VWA domain-containing protein [Candidatus Kerfeldbacteria bacterium]|nr:VWA domain-containing protein [Candidatus Kerfeldbacteria bacterium]